MNWNDSANNFTLRGGNLSLKRRRIITNFQGYTSLNSLLKVHNGRLRMHNLITGPTMNYN